MINEQLIFDVGMHKGEDTNFYLKKGFMVVGIEANPVLCEFCLQRFADEVQNGQLVIVNKAIAKTEGEIDFYINNDSTVWGTADSEWMLRNQKVGTSSHVIKVEAVPMHKLFVELGIPYYMKVDIEGYDHLCISALQNQPQKPKYVSIESNATSYDETIEHLSILTGVGYTKFKIVSQHEIHNQVCPKPAAEGRYVEHSFPVGASGLFGDELPGRWCSLDEIKQQYARIYRNVRMIGPHNGVLRGCNSNKFLRAILIRLFPGGTGWFDTHATH